MKKTVNVAIMGIGTVGGGTYEILTDNHDFRFNRVHQNTENMKPIPKKNIIVLEIQILVHFLYNVENRASKVPESAATPLCIR